MAKALLKTNKLNCDDLTNDEDPDCIFEAMALEIITGQNMQIQMMYDLLDSYRYPETDDCEVRLETTRIIAKSDEGGTMTVAGHSAHTSSSPSPNSLSGFAATVLGMLAWFLWV